MSTNPGELKSANELHEHPNEEEREVRPKKTPEYLEDYQVNIPGKKRSNLGVVKNRRTVLKGNLTKKINTIEKLMTERKSRRLINLTLKQLKESWNRLEENHKEFETLCIEDEERQRADTWLLETQERVEQIELEVLEYLEKRAEETSSVITSTSSGTDKVNKADSSVGGHISQADHENSEGSSEHNLSVKTSASNARAKQAQREARIAKLKVEQLKAKLKLETEIKAQRAKMAAESSRLDAELAIKEAEWEAARKEKEAELMQDSGSDPGESSQPDSDGYQKDGTVLLKGEELEFGAREERDQPKHSTPVRGDPLTSDEKVEKWMRDLPLEESQQEKKRCPQEVRATVPRLVSALPKIQLPTFDGDPLQWPQWYGLFKALVDSQPISTTEKMVYLKAAVSGTAERAVSGLLFDGSMYEDALKELETRFGNPQLISKTLIRRLLELPKLQGETTTALRTFTDKLHNVVRTLKKYGHDADLKAATNLEQVLNKLPIPVAERWSRRRIEMNSKELSLEDLAQWLEKEVEIKELTFGSDFSATKQQRMEGNHRKNQDQRPRPYQAKTHVATGASTQTDKKRCAICNSGHRPSDCDTWMKANTDGRWKLAKKYKLCFRCLDQAHRRETCSATSRCGVDGCDRNHHPQLHKKKLETSNLNTEAKPFVPARGEDEGSRPAANSQAPPQTRTDNLHTVCGESKSPRPVRKVALQTVPVVLVAPNGNKLKINALLDGGSGSSYIREQVAEVLGLEAKRETLRVSVFGAGAIVAESKVVRLQLESTDETVKQEVCMWTTPDICEMRADNWASCKVPWTHLDGVDLPEPVGHGEIDVLVGSDYYKELLLPQEHVIGNPGEPVALRTPLGWTLAGRVSDHAHEGPIMYTDTCHAIAAPEIGADEMLRKMWDADIVGTGTSGKPLYSPEEQLAIRKAESSRRYENGRYEIAIPWVDETPPLRSNRKLAEDRLVSLEKHLSKRPRIAEKYQEVLRANEEKGYIRKVDHHDAELEASWYLPHFPVVREDKQTTKVRIVYDSAVRYGGISLNDAMLPGPKLQRDVFDVLLRFRKNPVALVADLTEMFSQVVLAERDRPFHRFLWRNMESTQIPDVYESVRLPFGDRASPFLAQYVVRQHAEENEKNYPLVVPIVLQQMYMDDIMASLRTVEEAVRARKELITLFGTAGFKIRRWCSNEIKVLESVPPEDCVADVKIEESELPCLKTLGVQWNAKEDSFSFELSLPEDIEYTKRGFLKRLATLFDPLQMISPCTVQAKMMLQEAWLLGLGWDEQFPDPLRKRCEEWFCQLPRLSQVRVPRCYRIAGKEVVSTTIHTMTDASRLAYAAVTYVRNEYDDGEVTVRFVAAKAKVAPTKAVSIPRLELMGAVLGLRLARTVIKLLEIPNAASVFWTDSMDVIYWIQGQSRQYKTFVANRVSEIQQFSTPSQWRYVPTKENCADDATRGIDAELLTPDHRWFTGPQFLYQSEENWPARKGAVQNGPSPECLGEVTKSMPVLTAKELQTLMDPLDYSSWTRLRRVMATVRRAAIHWLSKVKSDPKSKLVDTYEPLTPEELEQAEKLLVKSAQEERFPEDLKELKAGRAVQRQSSLKALNPFLDDDGLLRVGGRLERANLPFEAKHPAILPKRHQVTRLVIADVHGRSRHMGVNHVLAEVRQRYWVIDGRQEVKNWDKECLFCQIRRAKPATQIMAPLPVTRLGTSMRAFAKCCVDYAGPFYAKLTRRVTVKRYLCLFTCSATRAVHLEMASSLSAADFLNAFSRMVAARGKPEEVTSDNGTNFVGAERELRELLELMDQEKIKTNCAEKGIKWNWNPPLGSHFGGVFESLVKVAKRTLKVIVGNAGLTDDELNTSIKEVEGLMNSRPLTYEGADERDEPALTPNHFLIGQAGGQLAPRVADEVAYNPRNRWRLVQDLIKKFWNRWRKEYMAALNTRKKWTEVRNNLRVGQVVLVVDQDAARGSWPLGRVVEVFPDKEGKVRVVRVKFRGHSYIRPISRLCPLNIDS